MWDVYILESSDSSYYVGYTNDIISRLRLHNEGCGATHTRIRKPVKLALKESHETKESAIRREKQIKGWSRAKKKALIDGDLIALCALSKRKT
jgi:putative endonuclease